MASVALLVALAALPASGLRLNAPSDVGDGKGAKHPCVGVMKETQSACEGLAHGTSDDKCNFAVCYTGDLNRDRCTDVVTKGVPKNLNFGEQLDKIIAFHGVKCDGGEQKGEGIRNARFDCGSVDEDGLWDAEFIQKFARAYPESAKSTNIKKCARKSDAKAKSH